MRKSGNLATVMVAVGSVGRRDVSSCIWLTLILGELDTGLFIHPLIINNRG